MLGGFLSSLNKSCCYTAMWKESSYLLMYRWAPPPLWRYPCGAAFAWLRETSSWPVMKTWKCSSLLSKGVLSTAKLSRRQEDTITFISNVFPFSSLFEDSGQCSIFFKGDCSGVHFGLFYLLNNKYHSMCHVSWLTVRWNMRSTNKHFLHLYAQFQIF